MNGKLLAITFNDSPKVRFVTVKDNSSAGATCYRQELMDNGTVRTDPVTWMDASRVQRERISQRNAAMAEMAPYAAYWEGVDAGI